jgi:hypothetical protein
MTAGSTAVIRSARPARAEAPGECIEMFRDRLYESLIPTGERWATAGVWGLLLASKTCMASPDQLAELGENFMDSGLHVRVALVTGRCEALALPLPPGC